MSPRSQLKVALAVFAFAALFALNLYFAEKVSRFCQTQPLFGKSHACKPLTSNQLLFISFLLHLSKESTSSSSLC